MHMADALLSPVVGGVMTAVSGTTLGYSIKKISGDKLDEKKIPMMGVMGAFVFAAQMINFTIPGTGSSGHIGGGILLAAILGPFPALITLSSVLLIQCLFFADGGLLAFGCNVFNIGICACLLAYTLLYKPIVKNGLTKKKITIASIVSVVFGLQIGAFSVVLETLASNVAELPFSSFIVLMQPIHLAIGLVEGIVTAAILCFLHSVRPEILDNSLKNTNLKENISIKKVITTFLIATVIIGGGLSLFASSHPDGLEWSIEGVTGKTELEKDDKVHNTSKNITDKTALMADYNLSDNDSEFGTAMSGIIGSVITIIIAGGIGFFIRHSKKKRVNISKSS